jgi:hypothetical protein
VVYVTATIDKALRYPFAKVGRLFYWLWLLVPVCGWLAYAGYILRIIQRVIKGNYKQVPKFGKFWPNFMLGLYAFVLILIITAIMIPFGLLRVFIGIPGIILYWVVSIYVGLISPILLIQLAETENLGKGLNFIRAHKIVFGNFREYIMILLKQLVVVFVYLLASLPIVTIIFTFPAMSYAKNYLYARFYRDVKKKPKY